MKKISYLLLIFTLLIFNNTLNSQNKEKLTDDELLTLVQEQTFKYFWDFAHPVSGLTRERNNSLRLPNNGVVTFGGSGFGVMAIVIGIERKFITREEGVDRMLKILNFLNKEAQHYHGIWPHWMNGSTGETVPFSRKDDGADLVETSFMFEGLLAAHQYFTKETKEERQIRGLINKLWREAEWNFFTKNGEDALYWHWSPNNGWAMNMPVKGYNECLITYVLAASSPTYPIKESVYHNGWTNSKTFKNGEKYYGITLPLGPKFGGPLFFTHYSFMGLDPRGLTDHYAEYWEQMVNHTLINRQYCIENPNKYTGYGKNCWGLTASDSDTGYSAHSPTNDRGVITPSAAVSAIAYTPKYSMEAIRYFYEELGDKLWGQYGFKDAFNLSKNWFAESYLGIDQGPIIVMIENYRSQLIWKLFMSHPDVKQGLKKLGFKSPAIN